MIDDSINYGYIIRYIRDMLPERTGLLRELELYAAEHEVPISQPETIKLLELLIKLGRRRSVLEVGAAIGYSAICMAQAGAEKIDTIEINKDSAETAAGNFKKAGLCGAVTLYTGDAAEVLPNLARSGRRYDMIFIDAAKAQYGAFFESCMSMLCPGGLLVSDNVLYKGMTATDELVLHRKRTIVKRLRDYVKLLCTHEQFETVVLPVGDGIALSIKRDEI